MGGHVVTHLVSAGRSSMLGIYPLCYLTAPHDMVLGPPSHPAMTQRQPDTPSIRANVLREAWEPTHYLDLLVCVFAQGTASRASRRARSCSLSQYLHRPSG